MRLRTCVRVLCHVVSAFTGLGTEGQSLRTDSRLTDAVGVITRLTTAWSFHFRICEIRRCVSSVSCPFPQQSDTCTPFLRGGRAVDAISSVRLAGTHIVLCAHVGLRQLPLHIYRLACTAPLGLDADACGALR